MRSLNSILDLGVDELDGLIATAKDIIAHPENYWDRCCLLYTSDAADD